MKELYLNEADGRKTRKLKGFNPKHPEILYAKMTSKIRDILKISKNEFLGFAQNATTNLIYLLTPILKKQNYEIYLSTHEIKWYKELFDIGKLPTSDTTFPNYAKQSPVSFYKRKITLFDPEEFIKNPKKFLSSKKPAIIILSHVSRMSGELFVTPKIYQKIKSINPNNILIVDGTQAVGALNCNPRTTSDAYLGVTSKFIGAELHIGFCWARREIVRLYNLQEWEIDPLKFSREIYSTLMSLNKRHLWKRNIKEIRNYFNKKSKKAKINILDIKNQVPYIALVSIKKELLSKTVQKLKRRGIIISTNTNWSIIEPEISALRISLTPALQNKQIDYLVKNLSEI